MSNNTFVLNDEQTKIVYLALQTLVQIGINNGDLNYAIKTDSLRASLRNNISRKNPGLSTQEVQEYYEFNASLLAVNDYKK